MNPKDISGLFEIHITVDINDLFQLRMYCMDQKLKPILAVSAYGDYPLQAMFSKYKNGTGDELILRAEQMATEMKEKYGINVLRVKVEASGHNEGVPKLPHDDQNASHYFEFHLKIPVDTSEEWQKLADECRKFNAHLSFNAFKKDTVPLVTLRVPGNKGIDGAIEEKDKMLDHVKLCGFRTNSGIQFEYSIYDTNVDLDKGWLH